MFYSVASHSRPKTPHSESAGRTPKNVNRDRGLEMSDDKGDAPNRDSVHNKSPKRGSQNFSNTFAVEV
jgi:hypothetical protein